MHYHFVYPNCSHDDDVFSWFSVFWVHCFMMHARTVVHQHPIPTAKVLLGVLGSRGPPIMFSLQVAPDGTYSLKQRNYLNLNWQLARLIVFYITINLNCLSNTAMTSTRLFKMFEKYGFILLASPTLMSWPVDDTELV